MKMCYLDEINASYYLAGVLPEIDMQILRLAFRANFAGVLQAIINFQRKQLHMHRAEGVANAAYYVGIAYSRGNQSVRYLIENLFIRSLGKLSEHCSQQEWAYILNNIPDPFCQLLQVKKV